MTQSLKSYDAFKIRVSAKTHLPHTGKGMEELSLNNVVLRLRDRFDGGSCKGVVSILMSSLVWVSFWQLYETKWSFVLDT